MSYEQQVWNAWTAGVIFFLVVVAYFVLSHRSEDHGPTLLARLLIMFREHRSARRAAGMESVYIPVSRYGMEPGGMENDEAPAPDIDAANTDMPRLSRNITDNEMIVVLAMQRGKDGKHRYSANAIHALVGGDRNTVMARIKELRETKPPAEYFQPDGTKAPASYPITGGKAA